MVFGHEVSWDEQLSFSNRAEAAASRLGRDVLKEHVGENGVKGVAFLVILLQVHDHS